jgi:tetratricopeptide (TPR) repeat protein
MHAQVAEHHYANQLNNFASLHMELGSLDMAEKMYIEALDVTRRLCVAPDVWRANTAKPQPPAKIDTTTTTTTTTLTIQTATPVQHCRCVPAPAPLPPFRAFTPHRYGKRNLDVARTLQNLAVLNRNLGRYDKALDLLHEATGVFRHVLGDDHPELAQIHTNRSVVLAGLNRINEAVDAARLAYSIMQRKMASDHPKLLMYVANLAKCLELKGTKVVKKEALGLYVAAARSLRLRIEVDHPLVPSSSSSSSLQASSSSSSSSSSASSSSSSSSLLLQVVVVVVVVVVCCARMRERASMSLIVWSLVPEAADERDSQPLPV